MSEQDKEAMAISTVVNALAELDESACLRVLEYAATRFAPAALAVRAKHAPVSDAPSKTAAPIEDSVVAPPLSAHADIKTLKEEKNPANAVQMAVLVAYYLKEIVQSDARKDAITATDVTKYFNQARYPLPTGKNGVGDTLNNARKSGYLETAGTGQFRLTPVGHNLAAYKMPKKAGS